MKRLTALALTGVLLLATACGGNQTNGTATNGDAGAAAAQQQTSDGAADPTAEATADSTAEATADSSAGTAGKTGTASGSRNKGAAKGEIGDGWEEYSLDDLNYKLSVVEPENIIEAGSGERLELEDPEW